MNELYNCIPLDSEAAKKNNLFCSTLQENKRCVRFSLCMGSSVNLILSKIYSELSGNQKY